MTSLEIPQRVRELFDGRELAEKVGLTAQMIAGTDGWSRAALLSVGEVLMSGEVVVLTMWAGSRTATAVRESGRGVLLVVADEAVVRIALDVTELPDAEAVTGRTTFRATVASVEQDRVAYARVTSGIGFELEDPQPVVERWEQQIELLRAIA
jgi:hypothetical protein